MKFVKEFFDISNRVAVVTGGAGMLGRRHAKAIAEIGGVPVLLDLNETEAKTIAREIEEKHAVEALGIYCDISSPDSVRSARDLIMEKYGRVDILVNNASRNPKVTSEGIGGAEETRLETYPLTQWNQDLLVGLTGAFLCAQAFAPALNKSGNGVILNISSDLGLIAPDQRLYYSEQLSEGKQAVKPVSYSVVKTGIIGLTRYLATYWEGGTVRANVLAPGSVYDGQSSEFVERLVKLIPLGRMAEPDEYMATIAFLVSDASAYLNGAIIAMDGGRTVW